MLRNIEVNHRPNTKSNRDYTTGQYCVGASIPGLRAPVERLVRVGVTIRIEHRRDR